MTDLNKEREALVAQIEEFKKDAMELWFVPDLAESYKNMDMFSYSIVENNEVFFMREQARQLWKFWNKAKAQAVPETHTLVSNDKLHEWYCMAVRSEELGCPECYEARGYVHNLACELNEASESGAEG